MPNRGQPLVTNPGSLAISSHNPEVQIMDLIRNSGLDPVTHGLLIDFEPLGDLSDRKKFSAN